MLAEVQKDYQIKRLSKERLVHLEELYKAVYKKEVAENFFLKKYQTAYTGVEYTGYVAYNLQDVPVGYYGVMPCFVRYRSEIVLAGQSGDTMTHPDYRYKGLFVELSEMTFDLCRKNGIRFLFGFPNQNSYHGAVQKLGWQLTETMDCFEMPVKALPLVGIVDKIPLLKPFYQRYVDYVLKKRRIDELGVANSVVKEGHSGVHRDENYFHYKAYSDALVLRAGRAKVWVKIKNDITVGDMEFCGESFDAVATMLKNTAARLGIQKIYFHASAGTELHNVLQNRFQSIPSFPVLFQKLDGDIAFKEIKFTFADIDIF